MTTGGQDEQPTGYEPFFGLREAPFGLAPDPRFLFNSATHTAALTQVAYALERREPLVVITGEIGTGKTLLCRTVLQRLERKTFVSIIDDPLLERDELLNQLLQDFGVIPKGRTGLAPASRHELTQALHAFLRSLVPIHAHAVVIIDEAQHLQPEVLEQIRLLSNVDDEQGTLLQIMLVGQTDLEPLLARPELRQIQQRVSRRLRLEPLNGEEVREYIEHRIARARSGKSPDAPGAAELSQELAAWNGPNGDSVHIEFNPGAVDAVSRFSGGLPRVINLLCDRSLEQAHTFRLHIIDAPLVHMAARALGLKEPAAPPPAPALENASLSGSVSNRQPAAEESVWSIPREPAAATAIADSAESLPESRPAPIEEPPAAFAVRPRRVSPRAARGLALAMSFALVLAVIWAGVRATRTVPASAPTAASSPAASAAGHSSATTPPATAAPEPESAGRIALMPEAVAKTSAPAAAARGAAGTAAAGPQFDIVVASFRTDARAASVATQVAALGLPMRRRVTDGWQQILAGPFTSRGDATDAQQRLDRAGLSGTQIVPAAR